MADKTGAWTAELADKNWPFLGLVQNFEVDRNGGEHFHFALYHSRDFVFEEFLTSINSKRAPTKQIKSFVAFLRGCIKNKIRTVEKYDINIHYGPRTTSLYMYLTKGSVSPLLLFFKGGNLEDYDTVVGKFNMEGFLSTYGEKYEERFDRVGFRTDLSPHLDLEKLKEGSELVKEVKRKKKICKSKAAYVTDVLHYSRTKNKILTYEQFLQRAFLCQEGLIVDKASYLIYQACVSKLNLETYVENPMKVLWLWMEKNRTILLKN